MNLNRQYRKGWRPRPADTIPEEWKMFCVKTDSGEGVFAVSDMVLCEIEQEIYEEMKAHIDQQTELQMSSVEELAGRRRTPYHSRTQDRGHASCPTRRT